PCCARRKGRQRLSGRRVGGEIRTAVVGVLNDHYLLVARRERLVRAERVAVIEARSAPERGRVVHLEVEAESRLEVGLVRWTARLLERRHRYVVGERAELEVV